MENLLFLFTVDSALSFESGIVRTYSIVTFQCFLISTPPSHHFVMSSTRRGKLHVIEEAAQVVAQLIEAQCSELELRWCASRPRLSLTLPCP